ncbi:Alpha/beta hydrolase [Arthrobacter sp. 9V]|uniref:alpha/beta fold hydrolase n=1 Tax=Arthrobacter sp. 9V TaxID=2653132 RepID=UPI0012F22EFF|nr:alpha/beta hydrolase [Arthrobacter sp. 9V]VXB48346.1 Alpha/beta hydrolase [Arthrobacter sp. 9V]
MRTLTFNREGTTLTAELREGSGPPVVIVPGVMSDAYTWRPVANALNLANPVIVLNRRGRLPSGPTGQGYSVRTEIDDLHHILNTLEEDVHLFGWSYGGLIALETATERRNLHSVIAYEPVSSPFGSNALEPLRLALGRGDLDSAVEVVKRVMAGYSAEYMAALRADPIWPVLRPLVHPLVDELAAINDHVAALSRYREITAPITLMLGERNEEKPPYGIAFNVFSRALPDAQIVRMANQGHLAHSEAPAVLAEHLTQAVLKHNESQHSS